MCGIVGLFLKDQSLAPELGRMLTEMLITMTDRGPDSAGIAIYGDDGTLAATVNVSGGGFADEIEVIFNNASGAQESAII